MKLADLLSKVALRYAAAGDDQNVEVARETPICICIFLDPNTPRMSAIVALDEGNQASFAEMVTEIAADLSKPRVSKDITTIQ